METVVLGHVIAAVNKLTSLASEESTDHDISDKVTIPCLRDDDSSESMANSDDDNTSC